MFEFTLLFQEAKLQNKMHIVKFICYFLLQAYYQLMEKSKSISNFLAFIPYFVPTKLSVSIPLYRYIPLYRLMLISSSSSTESPLANSSKIGERMLLIVSDDVRGNRAEILGTQ